MFSCNFTRNCPNYKTGDRFDLIRSLLADIGLTLVPPKLGELLPPLLRSGMTAREIRAEIIMTEARLRLAATD